MARKMVRSTAKRGKRGYDGKTRTRTRSASSTNSKEHGLIPVNLHGAKTKYREQIESGRSLRNNCILQNSHNSHNTRVSKKLPVKRPISPVITRSVAIQRQNSGGAPVANRSTAFHQQHSVDPSTTQSVPIQRQNSGGAPVATRSAAFHQQHSASAPNITQSVPIQRHNSGSTVEGSSRSNEQALEMVNDWLTNFQLGHVSTQDPPAPSGTEDGASRNPTHNETPAPDSVVPMDEDDIPGPSSPGGDSTFEGPSSVSSSMSAPSPSSLGDSISQSHCQTISSRSSSFASQEEQPDSTVASTSSGKPVRTQERRDKQRIASAKSRWKKKGETDQLKKREKFLIADNARLNKKINELEAEKKHYLDRELQVEDDDSDDETL